MANYSRIEGEILAQRKLKVEEELIICGALVQAGLESNFDLGNIDLGVIAMNSDSMRNYGFSMDGSAKPKLDFAGVIQSLVMLKGLEKLRWNGDFVIATENGLLPIVSKVVVKGKTVTIHNAETVFSEKGTRVKL